MVSRYHLYLLHLVIVTADDMNDEIVNVGAMNEGQIDSEVRLVSRDCLNVVEKVQRTPEISAVGAHHPIKRIALKNNTLQYSSIPSALKEICTLNLGSVLKSFIPASEFVSMNMQYLRNMKEVELMVVDYVMCK